MAVKQQKRDNDWISWALIVFLFAIGLSPLALILLFMKLFGNDEKQTAPPPLQEQWNTEKPAAHTAAGSSRAGKAMRQVTKSPVGKKSTALVFKIIGAVLAAVGIIACAEPIEMMQFLGYAPSYYIEDLVAALVMVLGGGGMFLSGLSMDRSLKRYAQYLAVLGDRGAMSIEELARTVGRNARQVEKDLQKMIGKGYFGGKAYLNHELGYFFRSGEADMEFRNRQKKAETLPPKEAEEGYSGILRNIRRTNDRIADPVLSAKIDRLESITAQIFRVVEADPAKRDRINTFLTYYLPTTQKLLDSYAEFEATGIEGENLRQAKSRIEKTMDSIVKGFEHQLDELYKSEAMDVDSDIRVMETMLKRDTASAAQDFGLKAKQGARPADKAKATEDLDLGGTAAQRETE